MDWLKKHAEAFSIIITIVGSVALSVLWITSQFSDMNTKMNGRFTSVDARFSSIDARFSAIEKDVAIIKTVMIMNHHMPCELAQHKEEK